MKVYCSDKSKSEPGQMFSWALDPHYIVNRFYDICGECESYGCYEATINPEDVYACIDHDGVILNPDKLYDIEYFNSIAEVCDEDALPGRDEGKGED